MSEVYYQCARCGSSLDFEPCATCEACMDIDAHGYGAPDCPTCYGAGTMGVCLSSPEWCESHPLPNRSGTMRHTPEAVVL